MARAVDRVGRGLQGVADDDVVDRRRIDAGALEERLRGPRPELDRREVGERAVVLRHRRPDAVDQNQVLYLHSGSS